MHNSAQLRCFENGNDDFGVEAFWIGDAARVGYFVPLNGPLNGHPPSSVLWPVGLLHDIDIHHGECMLQNPCFVDNIKLRRHICIGLSLYLTGFSSVVSTREIGTQSQCMLLIDPDDDEEEHDRKV